MRGLAILCMAAALGLLACTDEEKNTFKPVPSTEEAVDAVFRGHPHSITVCYEPSMSGYFLHYKEAEDGAPSDNNYHGWYLLRNVKFSISSNGSWFIGNQPDTDYNTVYPEVTGLTCKSRDPK